MSTVNVKRELFSQLARMGRALSHTHRLELLELLAQGERSVDALARGTGIAFANVSQHLQILRHAGIVASRKEGRRVYYRLAGDEVIALLKALRLAAEKELAEVRALIDTYLAAKDSLEPLSAEELLARIREGLVTVIDVRPPEEYAAGHLPGAVNIPLEVLEARLHEIPPDREVVAYCRGPYCVLAYEAVERLRKQGIHARRLEEGFPEWKLAGLPVDADNGP